MNFGMGLKLCTHLMYMASNEIQTLLLVQYIQLTILELTVKMYAI